MKKLILLLFCAISSLSGYSQEAPASHVDMTSAILDFLSRTELCLNTCRDAASVQAAIPELQKLKQECDSLVSAQRNLPEPTVQDYMAVQNQIETFTTIWNAIRDHIARLEQEKLLSEELRSILRIAPASHN